MLNINIRVQKSAEQDAVLAGIPRGFDAGGDANAGRPNVPLSTIVFWRNVPSRPRDLGPYDLWEMVEGNTSRILGAGASVQIEQPKPDPTPVERPVVTAAGVINGAGTIGSEQTVTGFQATGGGEVTYQWRRNGTDISGATAERYTTVPTDGGTKLTRRTTVTNSAGSASGTTPDFSIAAATSAPVVTEAGTVSGSGQVGGVHTVSGFAYTGTGTLSYQWRRNGTNISGATGENYTTVSADGGTQLTRHTTVTNSAGSASGTTPGISIAMPAGTAPVVTNAGTVSGSGHIGDSHTVIGFAHNGESTLTYQWRRNGLDIAGATHASYTPTSADENAQIARRTTVTNAAGSVNGTTPARTCTYPASAVIKTWTSRVGAADWSDAAASPFILYQSPWGLWQSNAGNMVMTTVARRVGGLGSPSMRTTTTAMPLGDGLPKGAPAIILGYHYNLESPVNPFKEGSTRALRSDQITSLRARFDGTDFGTDPNRGYLSALQLYASRVRFQGGGWNESGADMFDIQIRNGSAHYARNWPPAFGASPTTVDLDGVVWRWKREVTRNQGAGTRSWTFEPSNPALNVAPAGINVGSILNFIVAREVAVGAQQSSHIWVYGIQTWVEPLVGVVDYSVHSFGVELNGTTFGAGAF